MFASICYLFIYLFPCIVCTETQFHPAQSQVGFYLPVRTPDACIFKLWLLVFKRHSKESLSYLSSDVGFAAISLAIP